MINVLSKNEVMAFRSPCIADETCVNLVVSVLERRVGMNLTAAQVAEILCVSPRTLNRRLQRAGFQYRDVVRDLRLQKSQRYLKQTGLPVSEISRILGYSDCSNFIKAFKRWNGCTPRGYRRGAVATVPPNDATHARIEKEKV